MNKLNINPQETTESDSAGSGTSKKICFLLGSGISLHAGMPSVVEISKQILSRQESSCPQNTYDCSIGDKELLKLKLDVQFLRRLDDLAKSRYAKETWRQVNYEDLAYLATQIHDDFLGQYENPALVPLAHCLLKSIPDLRSAGELGELARRTLAYISCVVCQMLCKQPSKTETDYLGLFQEAIMDKCCGEVNLFSLNHDLLLERFLREKGIHVIDGFDKENALGIRRWNPELFDCSQVKTPGPSARLFKLHGSIDWRWFHPRPLAKGNDNTWSSCGGCDDNPWRDNYIGIRSNKQLRCKRDEKGRSHDGIGQPFLLLGTFNKILNYTDPIFLELHYRFYRILNESECLIVCGYSFGDKGINQYIANWLSSSSGKNQRKMILIDPHSFEEVRRGARSAIATKLETWKNKGQFEHFRSKIEDMTWNQLREKLFHKNTPA
jgi:hypothetical protein